MNIITYNSPNKLKVGKGLPVRVNCSFGIENQKNLEREIKKIDAILSSDTPPDIIMDLSVITINSELWQLVREKFNGPIGVLPHYLQFSETNGITPSALVNRIKKLFEGGVNFITIHCSPTPKLFSIAKQNRITPTTSRGGGVIIKDMQINNRTENVFSLIFDEVCHLAKEYGAIINLGTAFRSASVAEGFDIVTKEELKIQSIFCQKAKELGVGVVLEGPGHMALNQLASYWSHIKNLSVPPMPLGPIVTDCFSGFDHIVNSIGSANFMMISKGGIINSITAVEHKGGIPNTNLILEGVQSAKIAAQAASLTYCKESFNLEKEVSEIRGANESCILDSDVKGCARCSQLCPLIVNNYI